MSLSEVFGAVVIMISAIGSVSAVILSMRKSTNDIDQKNITSLQTRVQLVEAEKEDTKARLVTCEGLHRENLAKQGKMQGVIETLERTLENRDPKMQDVLTGILKFMEKIESHLSSNPNKTTVNVNPVPAPTV